jgi:hypothetical protein
VRVGVRVRVRVRVRARERARVRVRARARARVRGDHLGECVAAEGGGGRVERYRVVGAAPRGHAALGEAPA